MYPSALQAFYQVTDALEGHLDFMYADVKGFVTTGAGNLIDPVSFALELPWLRADGSQATSDEVIAAWNTVKGRTDLYSHGGGAFRGLTNLHLSEDGIRDTILKRLYVNEASLRSQFPEYDSWPADAQLAINSASWARGPNRWHHDFPRFSQALDEQNFAAAAPEVQLHGPGLAARNDMNYRLLENAGRVVAQGLPREQMLTTDLPAPGKRYKPHPPPVPAQKKSNFAVMMSLVAIGASGYFLYTRWHRIPNPLKVVYGATTVGGVYEFMRNV